MRSLPKNLIMVFFAIFFVMIAGSANANKTNDFQSKISVIPPTIQQEMLQYTWRKGCPVNLNNLSYLQVSYWGFDNKTHLGILIVNNKIAKNVVAIFRELYFIKFPIAKMQLLESYQGNDEKSMEGNNTVAFNCRTISGYSHLYSQHSFGLAIDINPMINPYIKDNIILPPQGINYLQRDPNIKGIIVKNNAAYNIFIQHGWKWGGNWHGMKDYQHFEY